MININNSKRVMCFNNAMKKAYEDNVKVLNSVLDGIEVSEEEEKTLLWLCEHETSTIQNIASVLRKVAER